jgi:hypothetical protein
MVKGTNSHERKVITPDEARKDVSADVEKALEKIIPVLEDQLRNSMNATLDISKLPANHLRDGIIKRITQLFKQAGWAVDQNSGTDCRDGDSWWYLQITEPTRSRSEK